MTRDDDIIRMAQEANMNLCSGDIVYTGITNLTRFHAIAVAEEREACAKLCEKAVEYNPDDADAAYAFAAAIRARGESK